MAGVDETRADCETAAPLGKFQHPDITADGKERAGVKLAQLQTLWVNTGTLCNIECKHCYIRSSPSNDRLVYLTNNELAPFLDEAEAMGAEEIAFTGGEPFLNKDLPPMMRSSLQRGFSVLVLTNAMRPMMRLQNQTELLDLQKHFGQELKMRISLDHYSAACHDEERGTGAFAAALTGLRWLSEHGLSLSVAGRTFWTETEQAIRNGFAALFAENGLGLNAHNPADLILFPEMDADAPVPEITTGCWDILGKDPNEMMCASSRMVVKRKGAKAPVVLACTLLAYDQRFELGANLKQAARAVKLNHPHCAKFCVLGGASCSG
jgi:uncharacterized Fe-S cluster-containing radical SAM superfamily protein